MKGISGFVSAYGVKPNKIWEKGFSSNFNVPKNPPKRYKIGFFQAIIIVFSS